MTQQLEQVIKQTENRNKPDSKVGKLITIIVTSLILLIPIAFLAGIINDRMKYRDEAVGNVAKSWANSQAIGTPSMYYTYKKGDEGFVNYLSLNNYEVTANINTEIRKKGIFTVPVYTATISQKGSFKNDGDIAGKEIITAISISDSRGFVEEPVFKVDKFTSANNQDTSYKVKFNENIKEIPFEITYTIKGLNSIDVLLGGYKNNVSINGNWKDPSFEGDFLPTTREVTNKDFKANWSVPKIALTSDNDKTPSVRVSLLIPVDGYSMSDRSLKYAFMLLVLTFFGYFIFEITSAGNKKIHPIQYCLLGAGILIFYLLLVSISELIPFGFAYSISALMVMGMIFAYTYFVITKKKAIGFSLGITALMGMLYAFFYILLRLQDIALLAGSIGLFVIIALIMYITRNVNWYNEQ